MRHVRRALVVTIFAAAAAVAQAQPQGQVQASLQPSSQPAGTASGLPVPRFVSLKSDKVNMHIGPAKTYEVKWLYQRAGLPVEITAEFETWRRIRDADGTEGWVYHSLLSGRRTGMVTTKATDELVPLYDKPDAGERGDGEARARRGHDGQALHRRGLVPGQRPRLRGLCAAGPALGRLSQREGGVTRVVRV